MSKPKHTIRNNNFDIKCINTPMIFIDENKGQRKENKYNMKLYHDF